MTAKTLIAAGLAGLTLLLPTGAAAAGPPGLSTARSATARYHDLAVARAAGYGLFTDAQGIACIEQPGIGAMGVHYANGDLVADPVLDPATPEVLVYEPKPNGGMRLGALEYVVLRDAWDATNASPPSLFGHQFTLIPSGNRYGLPDFYELHVWLWKHNPRGLFDDWNPNVSCAHA